MFQYKPQTRGKDQGLGKDASILYYLDFPNRQVTKNLPDFETLKEKIGGMHNNKEAKMEVAKMRLFSRVFSLTVSQDPIEARNETFEPRQISENNPKEIQQNTSQANESSEQNSSKNNQKKQMLFCKFCDYRNIKTDNMNQHIVTHILGKYISFD